MRILLDTGVVLRLGSPSDPRQAVIAGKLAELESEGHELCITAQILRESWVVMTRPKPVNGLGLSAQDAAAILGPLESAFSLLDELPAIRLEWKRLVTQYGVQGKAAHDANHVAAMIVHGIDSVLTLDQRDFGRYEFVKVLRL